MVKHSTTNELVKILKEWQTLEDQTIKLSGELMAKSGNAFIRVTTEMIRKDSEKHKAMLQFALDHLTKESVSLTPQDLMPLSEILDKHLQAEAKSMGLANSAVTKNKDVFTGYILSYLLADEAKHHEMLSRLDHMKGAVYQYGQSREERVLSL
jgi:chaperonin cofactor prefoldin